MGYAPEPQASDYKWTVLSSRAHSLMETSSEAKARKSSSSQPPIIPAQIIPRMIPAMG